MANARIFYEDRFVAYIDILGWSDASATCSPEVAAAAELIHSVAAGRSSHAKAAVQARAGEYKWINPLWLDSQAGAFSDNIVISSHADNGPRILGSAADIQGGLLAIGFLSRGGIAFGPVYHRDAIVMGPALVEAVRLEKTADMPRIVVAESALQAMSMTYKVDVDRELFDDGSGLLTVNPIPTPARFSQDYERMFRECMNVDAIEQSIANGLQRSIDNVRHSAKWQYMARVFPEMLRRSLDLADGSRRG
jgi:hypothetical protein